MEILPVHSIQHPSGEGCAAWPQRLAGYTFATGVAGKANLATMPGAAGSAAYATAWATPHAWAEGPTAG